MNKIIKKLLCSFFGYHDWSWTLKQKNGVCETYTGKIPDRAICTRCGAKYGVGVDYGKPNTH